MSLPQSAIRFKQLREELGYTQSAFAQLLGIKSTTADIERGRVKITGQIIKDLLSKYQINPLWMYGESKEKYLKVQAQSVAPQMITVDNQGIENILMVNVKAAAGYAGNINDQEFYQGLPAFSFPLPEYRNASFRGFQVEGDSMSPTIQSGDWILAKAINNLEEIRNGSIYVVVEEDSVRIKKLIKTKEAIQLISLNQEYPPVVVSKADVKEIWEFHSKLSTEINTQMNVDLLKDIKLDLEEIKSRI